MLEAEDNLSSVVSPSSAFPGGEEENSEDEKKELKFDPNILKTETSEVDENSENELEGDKFLQLSFHHGDESREGGNDYRCETQYQEKSVDRRRETTKLRDLPTSDSDLCDDVEDEDWYPDVKKRRKYLTTQEDELLLEGIQRISEANSEEKRLQRSKWSRSNESIIKRKVQSRVKVEVKVTDTLVKTEPLQDADDDTTSDHANIQRRTRSKRIKRRVSEVASKEAESTRKKVRKHTAKKNGVSGKCVSQNKVGKYRKKRVSEMTPEELEAKRAQWRQQKKKTNEMTPEELEATRAKWREEARRKQERLRQGESGDGGIPDKLAKFREKARERMRRIREQMKLISPEDTAEKQNRSKSIAEKGKSEASKPKRIPMTEEQRQIKLQKNKMRYIEKKAKMSEEELAEERMKNYMRYVARRARMTSEEREAEKQKMKEAKKKRWENMSEEEKQKHRECVNQKRKPYRIQSKRQRSQIQKLKKGYPNETADEKRERKRAIYRRCYHKRAMKRRLAIKQMLDNGMTMEEINQKFQNETNEHREHRRMIWRRWHEKNKLRKQLLASGASEEEIEAQLREFVKNYQFNGKLERQAREFKLQPERWKTFEIGREDLKLLSDLHPTISLSKAESTKTVPFASMASTSEHDQKRFTDHSMKIPVDPQTQLNPPFSNIQQTNITSPAVDASCSYSNVSAVETPERLLYPMPLYHGSNNSLYQHPNMHQNRFDYPMQPQSLSFNYQFEHTSNSHQVPTSHYVSSFDDSYSNSNPPTALSPESSDASVQPPVSHENFVRNFESKSEDTEGKQIELRKDDPSLPKKKRGRPKGRSVGQPIGPQREIANRDAICDECGNAYSSEYLKAHKRYMHNPYFKNGECTICGEKFDRSDHLYVHWRKKHCKKEDSKAMEQKHMCQDCGRLFNSTNSVQSHWHQAHGPGSLKGESGKCPICPSDSTKLYKSKVLLASHMNNCHKGYGMFECVRCPERLRSYKDLNDHIMEQHSDSYWPCKYCSIVKYSELGLNFHYTDRKCQKIPNEELIKLRKEIGNQSVDRFQLQCEFCDLKIFSVVLGRHYKVVHGVTEEKFECLKCDKIFNRREYWGIHLIDIHNVAAEECKERMSRINVKDRSNLAVRSSSGKKRGPKKQVKETKQTKCGRRRSRRKTVFSSDEDDDDFKDDETELDRPSEKQSEDADGSKEIEKDDAVGKKSRARTKMVETQVAEKVTGGKRGRGRPKITTLLGDLEPGTDNAAVNSNVSKAEGPG